MLREISAADASWWQVVIFASSVVIIVFSGRCSHSSIRPFIASPPDIVPEKYARVSIWNVNHAIRVLSVRKIEGLVVVGTGQCSSVHATTQSVFLKIVSRGIQ